MKYIICLQVAGYLILLNACNGFKDEKNINDSNLDTIITNIDKYNIIKKYNGYWIQPWAPRFKIPVKDYNIVFYKTPSMSATEALKVVNYNPQEPSKLKFYKQNENIEEYGRQLLDNIHNNITELRSLDIIAIKTNNEIMEVYIDYFDSTYRKLTEYDTSYYDFFLKMNKDKINEYCNADYKYVLVYINEINNKQRKLDSLARWYSSIREIDTNLYYYRSFLF